MDPRYPQPPAKKPPSPLVDLEMLIRERVVDVLGTFWSQRWLDRSVGAAASDPAILAAEIGSTVAAGVVRHLETVSGWTAAPAVVRRPNTVTLTADDIAEIRVAMRAQGGARITQLCVEATRTPGWPFEWVTERLTALGVLAPRPQSGGGGRARNRPVVSVEIHDDGSGTAVFANGKTSSVGPSRDDGLPQVPVTRMHDFDAAHTVLSFLPEPMPAQNVLPRDVRQWWSTLEPLFNKYGHAALPAVPPEDGAETVDEQSPGATDADAGDTDDEPSIGSYWSMTRREQRAWIIDFVRGLESDLGLDEFGSEND